MVHEAEEVGGNSFPGADLALVAGDGVAGGLPVELLAAAAAVGEIGSGGRGNLSHLLQPPDPISPTTAAAVRRSTGKPPATPSPATRARSAPGKESPPTSSA